MRAVSKRFLLLFLVVPLVAFHDPADPGVKYRAEITRTEYGIPHIIASNWEGLGYGHGYAYAQDNFCVLMREIVVANGQSAEFFGEADGNLHSDFVFQFLNHRDEGQRLMQLSEAQPEEVQALVDGYAHGFNRYLRETGVDNLPVGPAACRGEAWVRSITPLDLWKYYRKIALQGGSDNRTVQDAMIAATGPDTGPLTTRAPAAVTFGPNVAAHFAAMARSLHHANGSSNAIALGREATRTGSGLLLGNPHQPWLGSGRLYQVHLTIPGLYDVMGATLQGLPMVGIGFNRHLAWSHTTSFANRFTLFELSLNPDNPLQYQYDGERLDITEATVSARVRLDDGRTEVREHTFFVWRDGLIVNLGAQSPLLAGWPLPGNKLLAFRDANIDNLRGIEMWIRMGQAESLEAFIGAMKRIGNPLFHTLAADREGSVFYGDLSAIPHVTQAQLDSCVSGIGAAIARLTGNTVITLDGSTSRCNWGRDPDSPAGSPYVFGFSSLPAFVRSDYAANSNDSYWLSNAQHPLTGFPVVMGPLGYEGKQQFLRTQITHQMIAARLAGHDDLDDAPLFTLQNLQELMYNNRVFGADISLDDILTICADVAAAHPTPSAEQAAAFRGCAQLVQWDRRVNLESRGAHIFTEFWNELERQVGFNNILVSEDLWTVDFDPAHPITTPRGFDPLVAANQSLIIGALAAAVLAIDTFDLDLGAPWGELQVLPRHDIDVPIHGGKGSMGVFGAISARLGEGGYRDIQSGNSYIQVVTWDESDCPIAEGILTHSQSTDPESAHFADQSMLYSTKQWVDLPFCTEDIRGAAIDEPRVVQE
jgi:acyl-homoserine-lactone acylase